MNKAYFPQTFCCYALTSSRRSLPNSPQDDRKALDSGDQPAGTTALESRADSRKTSSGGRGLGKREVIYSYIWADQVAGGTLFQSLRRRGKKPNRRGRNGAGRGVIPRRVDISERPGEVEEECEVRGCITEGLRLGWRGEVRDW